MKRFLKYSLSLCYTFPFLIGFTIRLEDSITVMGTDICTKIFFNHAVKYTTNRPYANQTCWKIICANNEEVTHSYC